MTTTRVLVSNGATPNEPVGRGSRGARAELTGGQHKDGANATPPRARTLTEMAFTRLRRAIIECEFRPGQRASETEFVHLSGIGKTPVRDAIARLVQEGLVWSIPHHGYQIAPITLKDVQDVFSMRVILEGTAAQLAAGHVDAARLKQLDKLGSAGGRGPDDTDVDEHMRANREFHISIAEATGNSRLAEAIARFMDETERMFRLAILLRGDSSGARHHHRELVDALLAGDGAAARQITTEQLLGSERMIIEALMRSPSIQGAPVLAEPVSTGRVRGR